MGDVDRARAAGRTNAGPAGRGNDHGGPHGVPNARPVFTAPLVRGPGSPGDSRRTTGAPGRHECEAAWGTEQRRGSKTRDRRRQAIDDSLEPVVEARVCASRPTDPAIVECLTAAGRVPQAHVRVTAVGKAEHRCGAHVEGAQPNAPDGLRRSIWRIAAASTWACPASSRVERTRRPPLGRPLPTWGP